ncbi:gliding motility-associated C-terminal domain-containing protein, partial [Bacteroidota bacterium]
ISSYNNQTVTTCSGIFYDSGGQNGNFQSSEIYTITFCPATTGGFIQLDFTSFVVTLGDQMEIFDGPSTASTSFGVLNSGMSPVGMFIAASVLNTSGCLTVRWTSVGTGAGWAANVTCGLPCQVVNADLFSSIPPFTIDSGNYYIDICLGDTITLTGTALYPNNNQAYHQSDSTSMFVWDFGEGTIDTGRTIKILYDSIMGYNIELTVYDTLGCMSLTQPEIRVRVSTIPNFNGTNASAHDICEGDTIHLGGIVNPRPWQASSSLATAGITYLPDGSGMSYNSTLVFTSFAQGQILTNANDLQGICASLEHSYLGDLHIVITCPSNQTAILKQYPGGTNTFLGEPIDNNATPTPGLGYEYCWRPTGTITMNAAAGVYTHSFTDVLGNPYTNAKYLPPSTVYPPTSTAMGPFPIVNYQPITSFSSLLGCPLNGAWTITVTDNLFIDNGYIFSWGIDFNPNILPVTWGYTPSFNSSWNPHPSIINTSGTHATIKPDTGTYTYTFTSIDNLGCTYDTSITITTVPSPYLDLGNDTIICGGTTITLDPGSNPGANYQWSTGAITPTIPVNISGYYGVTASYSNSNIVCDDSDTVMVIMIPMPTLDLGADTCSTSAVTLDAGNSGANPPFLYLWSDGSTNQKLIVTTSGVYSVTVTADASSPCYEVGTRVVNIIEPGFLGDDEMICKHQSLTISAPKAPYGHTYTYSWTINGSLVSTNSYFVVDDLNIGQHTILVDVGGGCKDEVDVEIKYCEIKIPNVITPNGDGINDEFFIDGLNYYPNSELVIFNRWGKRIYDTSNYQNDWDGENRSDGVYYFVLRIHDGQESEFQGTITIMRK